MGEPFGTEPSTSAMPTSTRVVAVRLLLRIFDLIQVARSVVVDRRPQQIAHILYRGPGRNRHGRADGGDLGFHLRRKIGMKAVAEHFLMRGRLQIFMIHER